MTNEEGQFGAARRTPRQGIGGSPVGSWLSIALAVIAVIAGFLILRNITDEGASSSDTGAGAATGGDTEGTSDAGSTPVITLPVESSTTTTTAPPRVVDGASVMVANANTVGGSAGDMTKTLELAGYATEEPVNASGPNVVESTVYYDSAITGAQEVAESVARDLGGLEVLTLTSPAPTVSGDIGDAGVLVVLGDDEAGKTLEELSGATADGADAEGGAAAPDPSDGDVPVTAPADAETATTDG